MTQRDGRGIAFFDFDGTLVRGDSLFPFLKLLRGSGKAWFVLASSLLCGLASGDGRTRIKCALLRNALRGVSATDAVRAAQALKAWVRWIPSTVDALKKHKEAGDHIVIASGSLDLYLPVLLEGLPYDAILCTDIGVDDAGRLTGEMMQGNCVRKRKAERVKAYLEQHGPFAESWGYGNAPHDLPMMALLDHKIVI